MNTKRYILILPNLFLNRYIGVVPTVNKINLLINYNRLRFYRFFLISSLNDSNFREKIPKQEHFFDQITIFD